MLSTKLLTFALPVLVAFTTGCATVRPTSGAQPEIYRGPTAAIYDSADAVSNGQRNLYFVESVDGRKIESSLDATVSATRDKGLTISPVVLWRAVPARQSKLTLVAATVYAAPIQALLGKSCRTVGEVVVDLKEGVTYRVAGNVSPNECSAWLEEHPSGARASDKVTGVGLK